MDVSITNRLFSYLFFEKKIEIEKEYFSSYANT